MTSEQGFVHTPLLYASPGNEPTQQVSRNLGNAIILTAIRDYLHERQDVHESAANFLYPRTDAWRAQYEWALALAVGLNPQWLRGALDRSRAAWDVERYARIHGAKNNYPAQSDDGALHGVPTHLPIANEANEFQER